jgi:hypothetical protein
MDNELLIPPSAVAHVRLAKGHHEIHLVVSLGEESNSVKLVRLAPGASFSIRGEDEMSSQYKLSNWMSGLISGARYAFSTLKIPRQEVRIRECSARLDSSEMEALAYAIAMAVYKLANREMAGPEGWEWASDIPPSGNPAT